MNKEEYLLFVFFASGWILGVVLSIVSVLYSIYKKNENMINVSATLLLISLIMGCITTYPIILAILLSKTFKS